MPELPEVRTVVKYLKDNSVNQTIQNIEVFYPKLLKNITPPSLIDKLKSQTIKNVSAFGKFILIQTNDYEIVSHLRMEGKWVIEPSTTFSYPQTWLELSLELDNKICLNYYDSRKFGTFELYQLGEATIKSSIAKLGPEPFVIDEKQSKELFSILANSKTKIKTKLLDQSFIAGIGNIYVNEILFAAKINPNRQANHISEHEFEEIIHNSVLILTKSIEMGGTTIHSFSIGMTQQGSYQQFLQIHGKTGQKCPNCDEVIVKEYINKRGTYYCPKCQNN